MTPGSDAFHESYHAQHAPLGAFASFTVGLVDSPGGFGHALRGPAQQNVYAGYRTGDETPWRLLPFFRPPESRESAFTGEAATAVAPQEFATLKPADYERALGWASDVWRTRDGRFGFGLLSPFGAVPDPVRMTRIQARAALSPHINGWIEFDNTAGRASAELIFGVGDPDRLFRPLQETNKRLLGFAMNTEFGYATVPDAAVEPRQGFDVFNPKFRDHRGLILIGGESALVFTVQAGMKQRFPLVMGFFNGGTITTGLAAGYAYARVFADLEDVLVHGLRQRARYERLAALRDVELQASALQDDQKFLLAQATHSYLGSTQLLWGTARRGPGPLWVVNEGEYRMMNTFDLTIDHMFFELKFLPWAVRHALELFATRYAYIDRIQNGVGRTVPGGLSFTHDMGVFHHFTLPGRSSYECDNLTGCFSHMTMEQLLNWVLVAVTYAESTDDTAWLRSRKVTLLACARSLRRRDHPDPARRNGVLKHDSARCGTGAEITTYDSLDVSLGQARNNLYLAVKTLAAWVLLERSFVRLRLPRDAEAARSSADQLSATLAAKFDEETGTFPAVFEGDDQSRIIPAVEGFVYPLFLGLKDACDRNGRFGHLLGQLLRHLAGVLQPGICIDPQSGGWKMSSTSMNTWFSKIAIAQHVVRVMFPEALSEAAHAADRVHARWQRQPGCGAFAMCDQINSETGMTCGSRFYPRGVTAILWLRE